MIPKILHQTSPQPLHWGERQLARRARTLMPDWTYRLWSDADCAALVREILPDRAAAYGTIRPGVIKADIARCLFMHAEGGVYFDTDYRFFRPITDALRRHSCLMGVEVAQNPSTDGWDTLGNAFLAAEPGLPFWLPFVHAIFDRYAAGERHVVFLSGPHALTLFLARHPAWRALVQVRPTLEIYPPFRLGKLTTVRTPDTLGSHLCWGSWRHKSPVQRLRNRARIWGSALI
jgi:mannosyltransferase OCH1-like enzyme